MNAEYSSCPPQSNPGRTVTAATFLAQAKLLLLQEARETLSWRQRQGLRETTDRLTILIELLIRVSGAEASR